MRLVFAGTPRFAAVALEALVRGGHELVLVLTQPDRPAGRGMRAQPSPVKQAALRRGIPLEQPGSLRDPAAHKLIADARPQIMVVTAYGLILPRPVLELPALGAINIHASLLPRWRGAAPIQRALLAGDRETGITIMRMDAGLDTGPILGQQAIAISGEDDSGTLHERLALLGADLVVRVLDELQAGRARERPQPDEGVTYARKIDKGEQVLDWSRPAPELARAVRAFRPAPGASTLINGIPTKIWHAGVSGEAFPEAEPGTLLRAERELLVACGEGALAIAELQRAGGRRLPAGEFLRGQPLALGTRLGTQLA